MRRVVDGEPLSAIISVGALEQWLKGDLGAASVLYHPWALHVKVRSGPTDFWGGGRAVCEIFYLRPGLRVDRSSRWQGCEVLSICVPWVLSVAHLQTMIRAAYRFGGCE